MTEYEPVGAKLRLGDRVEALIDDAGFTGCDKGNTFKVMEEHEDTFSVRNESDNDDWSMNDEQVNRGDYRILKRVKKDEKKVGGKKSTISEDKVDISGLKSILFDAIDRIGLKVGEYGPPENSFGLIASFWSAYLATRQQKGGKVGIILTSDDVAAMMILLKLARHANGAGKSDNAVDIAGYAHWLEELRTGKEE